MPSKSLLASFALGISVFAIGVLYTLSQPKVYEATGVIDFPGYKSRSVTDTIIPIEEGLNALRGPALAADVEGRLSELERKNLRLPYQNMDTDIDIDEGLSHAAVILLANSEFSQIRDSRMISVRFKHQDPELAAKVCNSYMKSFIDYWLRANIDEAMARIEELRRRGDELKNRIEEVEMDLADARERRQNAGPDEIEELDTPVKELEEAIEPLQKEFEALNEEMTRGKAEVSLRPATAQIHDSATIPSDHIYPNIALWILLSAILGLFTSLASFVILTVLCRTN